MAQRNVINTHKSPEQTEDLSSNLAQFQEARRDAEETLRVLQTHFNDYKNTVSGILEILEHQLKTEFADKTSQPSEQQILLHTSIRLLRWCKKGENELDAQLQLHRTIMESMLRYYTLREISQQLEHRRSTFCDQYYENDEASAAYSSSSGIFGAKLDPAKILQTFDVLKSIGKMKETQAKEYTHGGSTESHESAAPIPAVKSVPEHKKRSQSVPYAENRSARLRKKHMEGKIHSDTKTAMDFILEAAALEDGFLSLGNVANIEECAQGIAVSLLQWLSQEDLTTLNCIVELSKQVLQGSNVRQETLDKLVDARHQCLTILFKQRNKSSSQRRSEGRARCRSASPRKPSRLPVLKKKLSVTHNIDQNISPGTAINRAFKTTETAIRLSEKPGHQCLKINNLNDLNVGRFVSQSGEMLNENKSLRMEDPNLIKRKASPSRYASSDQFKTTSKSEDKQLQMQRGITIQGVKSCKNKRSLQYDEFSVDKQPLLMRRMPDPNSLIHSAKVLTSDHISYSNSSIRSVHAKQKRRIDSKLTLMDPKYGYMDDKDPQLDQVLKIITDGILKTGSSTDTDSQSESISDAGMKKHKDSKTQLQSNDAVSTHLTVLNNAKIEAIINNTNQRAGVYGDKWQQLGCNMTPNQIQINKLDTVVTYDGQCQYGEDATNDIRKTDKQIVSVRKEKHDMDLLDQTVKEMTSCDVIQSACLALYGSAVTNLANTNHTPLVHFATTVQSPFNNDEQAVKTSSSSWSTADNLSSFTSTGSFKEIPLKRTRSLTALLVCKYDPVPLHYEARKRPKKTISVQDLYGDTLTETEEPSFTARTLISTADMEQCDVTSDHCQFSVSSPNVKKSDIGVDSVPALLSSPLINTGSFHYQDKGNQEYMDISSAIIAFEPIDPEFNATAAHGTDNSDQVLFVGSNFYVHLPTDGPEKKAKPKRNFILENKLKCCNPTALKKGPKSDATAKKFVKCCRSASTAKCPHSDKAIDGRRNTAVQPRHRSNSFRRNDRKHFKSSEQLKKGQSSADALQGHSNTKEKSETSSQKSNTPKICSKEMDKHSVHAKNNASSNASTSMVLTQKLSSFELLATHSDQISIINQETTKCNIEAAPNQIVKTSAVEYSLNKQHTSYVSYNDTVTLMEDLQLDNVVPTYHQGASFHTQVQTVKCLTYSTEVKRCAEQTSEICTPLKDYANHQTTLGTAPSVDSIVAYKEECHQSSMCIPNFCETVIHEELASTYNPKDAEDEEEAKYQRWNDSMHKYYETKVLGHSDTSIKIIDCLDYCAEQERGYLYRCDGSSSASDISSLDYTDDETSAEDTTRNKPANVNTPQLNGQLCMSTKEHISESTKSTLIKGDEQAQKYGHTCSTVENSDNHVLFYTEYPEIRLQSRPHIPGEVNPATLPQGTDRPPKNSNLVELSSSNTTTPQFHVCETIDGVKLRSMDSVCEVQPSMDSNYTLALPSVVDNSCLDTAHLQPPCQLHVAYEAVQSDKLRLLPKVQHLREEIRQLNKLQTDNMIPESNITQRESAAHCGQKEVARSRVFQSQSMKDPKEVPYIQHQNELRIFSHMCEDLKHVTPAQACVYTTSDTTLIQKDQVITYTPDFHCPMQVIQACSNSYDCHDLKCIDELDIEKLDESSFVRTSIIDATKDITEFIDGSTQEEVKELVSELD